MQIAWILIWWCKVPSIWLYITCNCLLNITHLHQNFCRLKVCECLICNMSHMFNIWWPLKHSTMLVHECMNAWMHCYCLCWLDFKLVNNLTTWHSCKIKWPGATALRAEMHGYALVADICEDEDIWAVEGSFSYCVCLNRKGF